MSKAIDRIKSKVEKVLEYEKPEDIKDTLEDLKKIKYSLKEIKIMKHLTYWYLERSDLESITWESDGIKYNELLALQNKLEKDKDSHEFDIKI